MFGFGFGGSPNRSDIFAAGGMCFAWVVLSVWMAGASASSGSIPADESLPIEEYVARGLPGLERDWTQRAYIDALLVLLTLDPVQRPRDGSPRSGPLFERLLRMEAVPPSQYTETDLQRAQSLIVHPEDGPSVLALYDPRRTAEAVFDRELMRIELVRIKRFLVGAPTRKELRDHQADITKILNSVPAAERERWKKTLEEAKQRETLLSGTWRERFVGGCQRLEMVELRPEARVEFIAGLSRIVTDLETRLVPADAEVLATELRRLGALPVNAPVKTKLDRLAEVFDRVK